MFEHFTEKAKRSIAYAVDECKKRGNSEISTIHLLLGILRFDQEPPSAILDDLGIPRKELMRDLEMKLSRQKGNEPDDIPFSFNAALVIYVLDNASRTNKYERIDLAHILLGLLSVESSSAARILRKYYITQEKVASQMRGRNETPASPRTVR